MSGLWFKLSPALRLVAVFVFAIIPVLIAHSLVSAVFFKWDYGASEIYAYNPAKFSTSQLQCFSYEDEAECEHEWSCRVYTTIGRFSVHSERATVNVRYAVSWLFTAYTAFVLPLLLYSHLRVKRREELRRTDEECVSVSDERERTSEERNVTVSHKLLLVMCVCAVAFWIFTVVLFLGFVSDVSYAKGVTDSAIRLVEDCLEKTHVFVDVAFFPYAIGRPTPTGAMVVFALLIFLSALPLYVFTWMVRQSDGPTVQEYFGWLASVVKLSYRDGLGGFTNGLRRAVQQTYHTGARLGRGFFGHKTVLVKRHTDAYVREVQLEELTIDTLHEQISLTFDLNPESFVCVKDRTKALLSTDADVYRLAHEELILIDDGTPLSVSPTSTSGVRTHESDSVSDADSLHSEIALLDTSEAVEF